MHLSERERAILDFEREWWTLPGPKHRAIRERFALSGARYYRIVAALAERDSALAYDPLTVRRLRRRRARREVRALHPSGERDRG